MTKPKPKPLSVVTFTPDLADPDVITIIEELLARAKTGEVRHFCYVAHMVDLENGHDKSLANQWGHGDRVKMIGAAHVLLTRLTNDFLGVEMEN